MDDKSCQAVQLKRNVCLLYFRICCLFIITYEQSLMKYPSSSVLKHVHLAGLLFKTETVLQKLSDINLEHIFYCLKIFFRMYVSIQKIKTEVQLFNLRERQYFKTLVWKGTQNPFLTDRIKIMNSPEGIVIIVSGWAWFV